MKPIVMLDMDGVISDFITVYNRVVPVKDSKQKFYDAVTTHKIFRQLPKLPNTDRLLNLLFNELSVEVQILSSLGTYNKDVAHEVEIQKKEWLSEIGVNVKTNFVYSWSLKENFSSSRTIMIDDREDVIRNFIKHGGQGVLYVDHKFDSLQHEIREKVLHVQQYLDMLEIKEKNKAEEAH